MEILELKKMETIQGGGFISGLCAGFGAVSIGAGIVASTNFWNPAGWVSAVFIAGDAACLGYELTNL